MSITAIDAAYEITRRKHNKANPTAKLPAANREAQRMTNAELRALVGVTEQPKVRKTKAERPKVAGTANDKRKRPKVFNADGSPLTPEQKAEAERIYKKVGSGTKYHEACAKAGIPTTKTVWVGDKLTVK